MVLPASRIGGRMHHVPMWYSQHLKSHALHQRHQADGESSTQGGGEGKGTSWGGPMHRGPEVQSQLPQRQQAQPKG